MELLSFSALSSCWAGTWHAINAASIAALSSLTPLSYSIQVELNVECSDYFLIIELVLAPGALFPKLNGRVVEAVGGGEASSEY